MGGIMEDGEVLRVRGSLFTNQVLNMIRQQAGEAQIQFQI